MVNAGIPTFIDNKHAIAHNKIMIIDQSTIITGSFNFTKAAEEKNAENLLIIRGDDALVKNTSPTSRSIWSIRRGFRDGNNEPVGFFISKKA